MLKIKLARFGKKHQPHYRIVVNEARDKRDGKYVAALGYYIPAQQPKVLQLDLSAYDEWMKKGAKPTETVASLADRVRSGKPFTAKKTISKKQKAKQQAASAPSPEVKEEAPAVVAEPAPTEEKVAEAPTQA